MAKHRHGVSALAALLLGMIVVGTTSGIANAQRNCRPWLTAAQQESARGNTQKAAESLRIYDECVRQAHAAGAAAGSTYGRNLPWVDPRYYGLVMDAVADPPGPRVVKIPGYRPGLVPGRLPGPIGGRYPGSPGQWGGSSACPGGCPPGTGGGIHRKPFLRSALGRSGPAGFAGRTAVVGGSPYAAGAAIGARASPARHPSVAARSFHAARSARGAAGHTARYQRPPIRRGWR